MLLVRFFFKRDFNLPLRVGTDLIKEIVRDEGMVNHPLRPFLGGKHGTWRITVSNPHVQAMKFGHLEGVPQPHE